MLNVSITAALPDDVALIVPASASAIPQRWQAQAAAANFTAEPETTCDILGRTQRIVLAGLGDNPEATAARAISHLLRCERAAIDARGLPARTAAQLAAGACLRAWHDDRFRTQPDENAVRLRTLDLVSDAPGIAAEWAAMSAGVEGNLFARDLVHEPSNTLTPQTFVQRLDLLVRAGVTLEIIDAAALTQLGAGGLLAVGQGSAHPPCLAVLRWTGTAGAPQVAFVGKGITFDTGGISIKPADRMWDMRADMAGAAACAGAMLALARRNSPASAIAVLPLAENAVGAASYRPGDVLRMLDGSTVQVVDTDAEGRLVLADALAYARRQNPAAIIDLATLTGSIVTALGHVQAGLFASDDTLAANLARAGAQIGEPLWRMPLHEAYRRALDSDIADVKHCVDGSGHPDACQAAAFLKDFAGDDIPWAHLDIAGVEERAEPEPRAARGPTGFGARLLDRLVANAFEPHG